LETGKRGRGKGAVSILFHKWTATKPFRKEEKKEVRGSSQRREIRGKEGLRKKRRAIPSVSKPGGGKRTFRIKL